MEKRCHLWTSKILEQFVGRAGELKTNKMSSLMLGMWKRRRKYVNKKNIQVKSSIKHTRFDSVNYVFFHISTSMDEKENFII